MSISFASQFLGRETLAWEEASAYASHQQSHTLDITKLHRRKLPFSTLLKVTLARALRPP